MMQMRDSANTALTDKSHATGAVMLQVFSVSVTHREGCMPFPGFVKALALLVGNWGVRFWSVDSIH